MGGFKEHIIFGFLAAATVAYFLKGSVELNYLEAAASAIAIAVGSVLPDIDHKNAYVHRAVKAFTSIGAAVITIIYAPFPIHFSFATASMTFLGVYTGFSAIKLKHRGFTHSISFAVMLSGMAAVTSIYTLASVVPGLALGLGIISHLALDSHFSLV